MEDNQNQNVLVIDDTNYQTNYNKKFSIRKAYSPKNPKLITAFIPGTIREVFVTQGQAVKKGQHLLTLEAMKMKNHIIAPMDGKVKLLPVKTGQVVPKNALLAELE